MKGIKTTDYHKADFADKKIAIVATLWNSFIVENLLLGAKQQLIACGIEEHHIDVIMCPGALEIPLTCQHLAKTKKYHGIITLGAVIRGDTPHFDYVAGECSRGIMRVSLDTGLPISFGVLTVDNDQQALARAGHGQGSENKGEASATCVLDMLKVVDSLS